MDAVVFLLAVGFAMVFGYLIGWEDAKIQAGIDTLKRELEDRGKPTGPKL